jgi:hypothetical protein
VGEIGYNRREFLYELVWWEIKSIIKGYRRRNKTELECNRLFTYYILCAMGAKIDKPEDLQKFSWDDEEKLNHLLYEEDIDYELQTLGLINAANQKSGTASASETGAEDETN